MEKFRKHIRYKNFDYSSAGDYFITLCSIEFQSIFSKIENGNVHLTKIGKIIEETWHELPRRFSSVKLGAFVIMPNHFHGIISIKSQTNRINLSTVVQHFKGTSTRNDKNLLSSENISFKYSSIWQSNFYEQIIKDEYHYYFVNEYILSNPSNWEKDKLYKLIHHHV